MRLSPFFRKPRLGVALGSGGLGGAAHIGVLQAFADAHVEIHALAGTSIGAIIAGLYACGWSPADMQRQLLTLTIEDLYDEKVNSRLVVRRGLSYLFRLLGRRPRPEPQLAFTRGDRIAAHLRAWTKDRRFADLQIPLAVVAADLSTGQRVIFTGPAWAERVRKADPRSAVLDDVPLWLALRASMSIPGVFEPARVAGRTLVDGGLVDPVPDSLLAPLGASVTVAVSLENLSADDPPVQDLPRLLSRAVDVMTFTIASLRSHPDVVIQPGTGNVGLLELNRLAECVKAGEAAARASIPAVRRALARRRLPWATGNT
ncbi:MAG TPA: patatin-like phospholipase family protein [Limnochordales bacterium]